MKKYVTKLGLFLGLVSFIPVMLVTLLSLSSYQPILTNSLSFDTKLNHILAKDLKKVDVMVHGSSIALNNFHSETFNSYLSKDLNFYNFSSWNLNMENNHLILDVFTERFEPETVILPSCYEDFQHSVVQLCSKSDLNLFLDEDVYKRQVIDTLFENDSVLKWGKPKEQVIRSLNCSKISINTALLSFRETP